MPLRDPLLLFDFQRVFKFLLIMQHLPTAVYISETVHKEGKCKIRSKKIKLVSLKKEKS